MKSKIRKLIDSLTKEIEKAKRIEIKVNESRKITREHLDFRPDDFSRR